MSYDKEAATLLINLDQAESAVNTSLDIFSRLTIHGMSQYTRSMVINKLCDIAGELVKVQRLINPTQAPMLDKPLDGADLARRAEQQRNIRFESEDQH